MAGKGKLNQNRTLVKGWESTVIFACLFFRVGSNWVDPGWFTLTSKTF